MTRGQQDRMLEGSDPSSGFRTDVTPVVGTATTQIGGNGPIPPMPGHIPPTSSPAMLDSVLQPGVRFGPFRLIRRLGAAPREMCGKRGGTSRTPTLLPSKS